VIPDSQEGSSSHGKEYGEIAAVLRKLMPDMIPDPSDHWLYQFMARADCNQFGLWSPKDDLLGVTLHPSASFFNHSCIPNTFCEWSGVNLVFKTLHPVPKGTELNIAYIAANQTTKKRRKELKKVYCFDCVCPRCVRENGGNGYPCNYFDKFYEHFIGCPTECTGILRAETVHPGQNGESGTEDRECITCSTEFKGRPIVPPIREWLAEYEQRKQIRAEGRSSAPTTSVAAAPSKTKKVKTKNTQKAAVRKEQQDLESQGKLPEDDMEFMFQRDSDSE